MTLLTGDVLEVAVVAVIAAVIVPTTDCMPMMMVDPGWCRASVVAAAAGDDGVGGCTHEHRVALQAGAGAGAVVGALTQSAPRRSHPPPASERACVCVAAIPRVCDEAWPAPSAAPAFTPDPACAALRPAGMW